jgi:hypothetical protein
MPFQGTLRAVEHLILEDLSMQQERGVEGVVDGQEEDVIASEEGQNALISANPFSEHF